MNKIILFYVVSFAFCFLLGCTPKSPRSTSLSVAIKDVSLSRLLLNSIQEANPQWQEAGIRKSNIITETEGQPFIIYGPGVSDLRMLRSHDLAVIWLIESEVKKLSFLSDSIRKLQISNFPEEKTSLDVAALEGKALEDLALVGFHLENQQVLSTLKNLKYLNLRDSNVKNIDFLKDVNTLRHVDLSGTNVTDLSSLNGKKLDYLNISNTPIKDVPLSNEIYVKTIVR